jgi:outer membrane protein TolC
MFKKAALSILISAFCISSMAQTADDSGISAGFFDSSEEKDINYSEFKLPPLAVLFENAKQNPNILHLAKQQEIAQAEVVKQKKHIFSYVSGHASASYGMSDIWSGAQGTGYGTGIVWQPHASEQSYWNVGVNVSVPLEDILDLGHSVKRKRLVVEDAQITKDAAYDELKLQIVTLYIKITNNLTALKTAGENAAAYQGASSLNEVEFHHGNMEIEEYAYTGLHGQGAMSTYQSLLTQITTDIVTLEILTHTPIITNTTTDITLDSSFEKSKKQIAKENKEVEKRIKKAVKEEIKLEKEHAKQEEKAAKEAEKANNSK